MTEKDYLEKIQHLEAELAKERKEKEFHKENARALMFHAFPCEPLTPEEERRLMTDIDGKPIDQILDELRIELGR
jgi:hypothetical protein